MTDVLDLHKWMKQHFENHPLFVPLTSEEIKNDIVIEKLYQSSEEGQKVTRNNGEKFLAAFKRVKDPYFESEKKT